MKARPRPFLLLLSALAFTTPPVLAQAAQDSEPAAVVASELSPRDVVVEWADDVDIAREAFVPEDRTRFAALVQSKALEKYAPLATKGTRPVRILVRIYALGREHRRFSDTAVNFVAAEVSLIDVRTGETLGTAPEVTGTLPEIVSPLGRLVGGNPFIRDRTDWLAGSLAKGVRDAWVES